MMLPKCTRFPNQMKNVDEFIRSCSLDNHSLNSYKPELIKTGLGSINKDGVEGSFKAKTLPPNNPWFRESLEEGVRDLVIELFNNDLMPYTSCEGHVIEGTIHEAHVGILSQGLTELKLKKLKSLNEVGISLFQHTLIDSETSASYPTLELYILNEGNLSPKFYRENVKNTIDKSCKKLSISS